MTGLDDAVDNTSWTGSTDDPLGPVTVTASAVDGRTSRVAAPDVEVVSVPHSIPLAVPPRRGNVVGLQASDIVAPEIGCPALSTTVIGIRCVGSARGTLRWAVRSTPGIATE